jgi:hypothetical protein
MKAARRKPVTRAVTGICDRVLREILRGGFCVPPDMSKLEARMALADVEVIAASVLGLRARLRERLGGV